jgi:cytochrome c peroxidase
MNTRNMAVVVALLASGCAVEAGSALDGGDVDESAESSDLDAVVARHCDDQNHLANNVPVADATGVFTTVSAHGSIDLNNEFFQDLGTNGRRCVSCHVPTVGWTITPKQLKTVFDLTDGGKFDDGLGLAAVFRTVDGSNSPTADVSTLGKRRQAYSMLLNRGVIRVGLPIPANAEFELIAVDDPYHFASASELSLFRRPLPTTNLKFDSTVMWDGREVVPGQTVAFDLANQANDATLTHAQGQPLTAAQRESIVSFETALASAQIFDRQAGNLREDGAKGGPAAILGEEFYIGINDNFGDSRTGAAFNPVVFNLFDAWTNLKSGRGHDRDDDDRHGHGRDGDDHGHGRADDHGKNHDHDDNGGTDEARRSIARGQALFNSHPIAIAGVSGINDEAAFGKPAVITGTCTTCHNTPNGGNHSVVAPLNIGLVDASRRTKDMPLYTLRNKTTGETVQVTDPGRAMIDGKWSHIGRFKGPMLRNLAPRAPYFHNGFAADLDAVVDFYNDRFHIGFTKQDKADLVAFLRSL